MSVQISRHSSAYLPLVPRTDILHVANSTMASKALPPVAEITHIADLTPPSQDRVWYTSPHPDLPIVACCGADKSVRIYSLSNFTLLSTISGGHKRSVRSCAWKPHVKGESVLATASFDATAGIWKRWDGYGKGENDGPRAIDENGDALEDEDDDEWGFAVLLDGHDSEVKSISWSPSGSLLATCSRDKSIWIWEDLEDGDNNFETVAVLQEHTADVKCVVWHPAEECLASGSYDDTIRLWREDIDDWGQIACLRGHEGTVWSIDWESAEPIESSTEAARMPALSDNHELTDEQKQRWVDRRSLCGPRLASCSDDKTVRIWRKEPSQRNTSQPTHSSVPSVIQPTGIDETWIEEAQLPHQHELSIYAVAWNKRTGLVASAGADGKIVVYQEYFGSNPENGDQAPELNPSTEDAPGDQPVMPETHWRVVASIDAAHDIYEINHICWATSRGKQTHEQTGEQPSTSPKADDEEILLTSGDDGCVKAWKLTI